MPDAFIWYHADEKMEPALLEWMDTVQEKADVRGNLYIRKQDDKTTFMETYRDVSSATIKRIESMADKHAIFDRVERRCESFVEIT